MLPNWDIPQALRDEGRDQLSKTNSSLLASMTVNDARGMAEASGNGSDELTKVGSDLSDEIEDITIQDDKAGDSIIPSNMAPLGGVSVAAQRRDEYDINFE
jgi:hypothetical protein